MSRANPFSFVSALKSLGVSLVRTNEDGSTTSDIRVRPLFRRLERNGISIEYSQPTEAALKSFGFTPCTVFDIGVDNGTPLIYNSFPDARFILVDPVAESEQKVERWKNKINYSFINCALGSKRGEAEICIPTTTKRVRHSRATLASFSKVNASRFEEFETRQVQVHTLDSISKDQVGPFGIKIDAEGFELEVIKGATQTLNKTEFVIAEVSVKRRYDGGYKFSELVAELGKNGFEIIDFLRPVRPDAEDCDILFARYDSTRFDL
ncbi:hypothetical protein A9Q96_11380 [Rhodobacterales bacterium 52_120_T64]|mgnify:CR=1 FL=1|nr:hypothetical protein A9Q96_11380 [Rhodobacterales bacterium 52_120_T64]